MNDTELLAELNDPAGPNFAAYAAAGWGDPLPTLTGDPSDLVKVNRQWFHRNAYTQADNDARVAHYAKYDAIAALLNAKTRDIAPADITEAQIANVLDMDEVNGLSDPIKAQIDRHARLDTKGWRRKVVTHLQSNGATRTALAALKQSRADELGSSFKGKSKHVKAGHIKRVAGDTT